LEPDRGELETFVAAVFVHAAGSNGCISLRAFHEERDVPTPTRPQRRLRCRKSSAWQFFSGDCDPDLEGATAALRQRGFEVLRLPEKFRPLLWHPRDDCLEVSIDAGSSDPSTLMDEVSELVDRFGAEANDFGVCGPDHVPFSFLIG
jgi:hypothetical protein